MAIYDSFMKPNQKKKKNSKIPWKLLQKIVLGNIELF